MSIISTAERVALRDFLKKNPGFIPALKSACPAIKDDQGTEVAAMTGCTHKGAEAIIEAIESMAADNTGSEKSPFVDSSKD